MRTLLILLSSQGDVEAGNDHVIDIAGGLVYYLAVFPEETVGATQDYYVEMVEEIQLP
jgi:hypothetical protein